MISSRVKLLYLFNFITKKVNAESVVVIAREDIEHIAFDAEIAVPKFGSCAGIETLYQSMHQLSTREYVALFDCNHVLLEFHRVTNPIQARHRCHDQHIAPARQESRSCTKAQFFNFIVDRKVFFDISTRSRDIGFRLIVVVVRNEVFHCIIGEEGFKLRIQLSCQRFVMCQHKGRVLDAFHHIGDSKSFSRARNA